MIASIALLPGPILYGVYTAGIKWELWGSVRIFASKGNLSVVAATFSFTMLGFLAAIMAILVGLTKDRNFRRYVQQGYLSNLILFYGLTIASLFATFGVSLLSFSRAMPLGVFHTMMVLLVNNIWQTALISLAILNIWNNAFRTER